VAVTFKLALDDPTRITLPTGGKVAHAEVGHRPVIQAPKLGASNHVSGHVQMTDWAHFRPSEPVLPPDALRGGRATCTQGAETVGAAFSLSPHLR
jgi:hypothetical protein